MAELKDKVGNLTAELSGLQFVYNDPEKNFDRRKVKGLVANLITLKDTSSATALEVAAGGKLYNVVVDSEITGKALLSKAAGLKRRVTIIPLNKINNRTVDEGKIRAAESMVGEDNVTLALSLVGYNDEVQNAMNFVFGNTLVCKDPATAKQVTFDKQVLTRTVTLEGDVYDPAGTLTGGSRPSATSILVRLQGLNDARAALHHHESILADVTARLAALKDAAAKYRELKQQQALREHEVELIQTRLDKNPHHQLIERVRTIEKQLETEKSSIVELEKKEQAANDRYKDIEKNSKNFASRRDSKLKGLEVPL